jgi:hypothetical protein
MEIGQSTSRADRAPEPTNPTPETTDRLQDTTNQPPRRRIGLPSQQIERRADRSAPEPTFRFLKPADEFHRSRLRRRREQPDVRAGARTTEAGVRFTERTIRAAKAPARGRSGRTARRADGSRRRAAGRAAEGAARRRKHPNPAPNRQFAGRRSDPGPRADIRRPEQTDSRPSNQIRTRATTRRVRAVESVSVHHSQFSIDHPVLPFKHHAPAPHRARVRPAPHRTDARCIEIEQYLYRTQPRRPWPPHQAVIGRAKGRHLPKIAGPVDPLRPRSSV